MKPLTIGEIARQATVGVETIRFYERRGLIEQPAKPNGSSYRTYPEDVVKRVRFIQQAQEIGFSLREIQELLALRSDRSGGCGDVRDRAVSKLKEVRDKINKLRRVGAALETLIAACPGCGPVTDCSILEALDDGPGQRPNAAEPGFRRQRERKPVLAKSHGTAE